MSNALPHWPSDAAPSVSTWSDSIDLVEAFTEIQQVAKTEALGAAITLRPVGPALGTREVQVVLDAAIAQLRNPPREVRYFVFDLSDVRSMTAYGLGLCSDLAKRASAAGLQPILFGASRETLDALRMFKTERLYKVIRSRNDLVVLTQIAAPPPS
ncbi:MAG: hypothetical protein SGJ09_11610 [Phycisphaerae bacterium]|nr:hypothetical protein [Phycisphaerae bacterium]